MRKLLIALTLFILASGGVLRAQSVFADPNEFGIMIGGSNYFGDLAYKIVPGETHIAGGLIYRYRFDPHWALKAALNYGRISGTDQNFEEYKDRNLSFRNDIIELTAQAEFNLFTFTGGNRTKRKYFTPYALLGLSIFYHSPKALLDNEWRDLRSLGTEGQTMASTNMKKYSQFQAAIPMGVGVKYQLTRNWILGFEVGYRKTFTDYLDDVSGTYPADFSDMQKEANYVSAFLSHRSVEINNGDPKTSKGDMRGDPVHKDWFIFSGLTVMYNLVGDNCPANKRR